MCIVNGYLGSDRFMDVVVYSGGTVPVTELFKGSGDGSSPATRTYAHGTGGDLNLTMGGSSNWTISCLGFGGGV